MWPFKHNGTVPPGIDERVKLLAAGLTEDDQRMNQLTDRMAALERRFTKLQGEVSREWRDRYERADVEYDDEDVEQ